MAKIIERPPELPASQDTVNQRLATCDSCAYKKEELCMSCNCIIESKVLLQDQSCPEGKW